jgi:ribulose 1,5-bisphosphate carboxylase large subunit-like protein
MSTSDLRILHAHVAVVIEPCNVAIAWTSEQSLKTWTALRLWEQGTSLDVPRARWIFLHELNCCEGIASTNRLKFARP